MTSKLYEIYLKPSCDVIFALFLIVCLIPLIIVIWILVYFKLGRPVLYCQIRPGKDEKLFNIYKFRTMTEDKDLNGNLLPDNERITSFGLFLRKSSMDELPQLFNVIKGDLSFIGPRPLLTEYLNLYNTEQKKRHNVKPGITGLAQVNGRNALLWEDKFKLDIFYVQNLSLLLDIRILVKTIIRVLKRSDINNEVGSTMEKFTGNRQ